MALSSADQRRFEQEQAYLEPMRLAHPDQFTPVPQDPIAVSHQIGIMHPPTDLPKGFIKYSPLDFIVEEIRPNGHVITTDGLPAKDECEDGEGTVYVDLTKVGFSTLDAIQRLQDALHIEQKFIGHAGIKDAVALTGQRLSLRTVTKRVVESLSIPGVLLRNVVEHKGAIAMGNLYGNRFTLCIRTESPIDVPSFQQRLKRIQSHGVMNYYGPQRFGTPRFFAHEYGRFLLREEYDACIKQFLTQPSPFEIAFIANMRRRSGEVWGDWAAMREVFSVMPYTFRHELILLDALVENPKMTIKALGAIGQQANMWVRAYASYLANKRMSVAEQTGQPLSDEIPLLLGRDDDPRVNVLYGEWLKADGTMNYMAALKKLRFVQTGKQPTLEPVVRPTIWGFEPTPEGVAICFDLPKGAYATTILMNLFDTVNGYPIPDWVQRTDVDTKKILGTGSLDEVKRELGEYINAMMANKQNEEE